MIRYLHAAKRLFKQHKYDNIIGHYWALHASMFMCLPVSASIIAGENEIIHSDNIADRERETEREDTSGTPCNLRISMLIIMLISH